MAQDVIVTSIEAEGSDSLREFLVGHQTALKLTNATKLNNVYNKLSEKDIDYDELLEFENQQLYDTLVEECQISKLEASRIIKVLKTIPQSTIYKQQNNVTIVTVSNAEQDAIDNIQNATKKVQEIINNIAINMSELDENSKQCENAINYNFDNIIKTANKRRGQLLSNLKTIQEKKKNKLLSQQNEFNSHKKELNNCYEKSQRMIHDLNIDKQQRKSKILTNTNQLLQNRIIDNFSINTNIKMNFEIDVNKINNVLLNIGEIQSENIPLPPVVYAKRIKDTSVIIAIASNTQSLQSLGIEYKLEYIECNDDIKLDDDMKLEWKSINIKYNPNIKYEIKLLKPLTKYTIHGAVRNKNGWSEYCENISFKTKQRMEINDQLDPQNMGTDHTLNGNIITHTGTNKNDSNSFFTKIVTTGHCHWRFKIKKIWSFFSGSWMILGIWKTETGNPPKGTQFTLNKNGYAYNLGYGCTVSQTVDDGTDKKYGVICNTNDIIDMHLNMKKLTLKYSVNNKDQGIAYQVENTSYKAAIGTFHKDDCIEFVKYTQD